MPRKNLATLAASLLPTPDGPPPVDVEAIAEKLHIELVKEPFEENRELSGMLVREGARAFIAVNAAHSAERMRFTIAHELGHALLDDDRSIWIDRGVGPTQQLAYRGAKSGVWEEIRANRFAAALLMPADWVQRDFQHLTASGTDWEDDETGPIRKMATQYDVSFSAMLIRLVELKLIARPAR